MRLGGGSGPGRAVVNFFPRDPLADGSAKVVHGPAVHADRDGEQVPAPGFINCDITDRIEVKTAESGVDLNRSVIRIGSAQRTIAGCLLNDGKTDKINSSIINSMKVGRLPPGTTTATRLLCVMSEPLQECQSVRDSGDRADGEERSQTLERGCR